MGQVCRGPQCGQAVRIQSGQMIGAAVDNSRKMPPAQGGWHPPARRNGSYHHLSLPNEDKAFTLTLPIPRHGHPQG